MRTLTLVLLAGLVPAFAGKPAPPADPHPLAGTYTRTLTSCFFGCITTETTMTIDSSGNVSGKQTERGNDPFMGRGTYTIKCTIEGAVDDAGRLLASMLCKYKGNTTFHGYDAWLSLDANGDLRVQHDYLGTFTLVRVG